ncbi:MAG: YmdB family metallophosphoesterase [Planctomycetes bacterium]|nr:YmdB family metallophosphoesterase [Planctomycetota bacterium]
MRILLIGDIVGSPGVGIVAARLPALRAGESIDFVIANGENAAGGSGITPALYKTLRSAGVDCVTLGDHIYRRREICGVLESDDRILKPANYPASAPGRGWTVLSSVSGVRVGVVSLLGRVFMRPVDCPWEAADVALDAMAPDCLVRVVDFHGEATSDKQLMGRYLDGRVTAVLGTHTHVATADECILPGGTAFQCDVGMTGPHESILGRRIDRVLETTRSFRPTKFDVASGDVRLCGTLVDVDPASGKATGIRRLALHASQDIDATSDGDGPADRSDAPSDSNG